MIQRIIVPTRDEGGTQLSEMLSALKCNFLEASSLVLYVSHEAVVEITPEADTGQVSKMARDFGAAFGVAFESQHGGFAEAVLQTAREWSADLIVIEAEAPGWLQRLTASSITQTLLQKSALPVLVWKEELTLARDKTSDIKLTEPQLNPA